MAEGGEFTLPEEEIKKPAPAAEAPLPVPEMPLAKKLFLEQTFNYAGHVSTMHYDRFPRFRTEKGSEKALIKAQIDFFFDQYRNLDLGVLSEIQPGEIRNYFDRRCSEEERAKNPEKYDRHFSLMQKITASARGRANYRTMQVFVAQNSVRPESERVSIDESRLEGLVGAARMAKKAALVKEAMIREGKISPEAQDLSYRRLIAVERRTAVIAAEVSQKAAGLVKKEPPAPSVSKEVSTETTVEQGLKTLLFRSETFRKIRTEVLTALGVVKKG